MSDALPFIPFTTPKFTLSSSHRSPFPVQKNPIVLYAKLLFIIN